MAEQRNDFGTTIDDISHQNTLDRMIEISNRITKEEDGHTKTLVPFLSIVRNSFDIARSHGVLTPSFYLILQGSKNLYLGEEVFYYKAGDYMVSLIDVPASAKVSIADQNSPYIALRINISMQEIASVATEADISMQPRVVDHRFKGAFVGSPDASLLDIIYRLLKLNDKPEEVLFLSELLKKEMIYNILVSNSGHFFLQKALMDQKTDGVGKAIQWIKENYGESFKVEELAKSCNISVSGLHHKFKEITMLGPLQYQKQMRLLEARRLMLKREIGVTAAAQKVGYESPSQFNREYRRQFGQPPLQDVMNMRKSINLKRFEDL